MRLCTLELQKIHPAACPRIEARGDEDGLARGLAEVHGRDREGRAGAYGVAALKDPISHELLFQAVNRPARLYQDPGEVEEPVWFRASFLKPLAYGYHLLKYPGAAEEAAIGEPPEFPRPGLVRSTALAVGREGLPVPTNRGHASRKLAARFIQPAANTACELAALISPPYQRIRRARRRL